MTKIDFLKVLLLIGAIVSFTSCEEDEAIFEDVTSLENFQETIAKAVYGSKNVWFNSNPAGPYSIEDMEYDFGNVRDLSLDESERQTIYKVNGNSMLRVQLLANELVDGGVTSKVDLQHNDEYTLEYKVRFKDGFDWKKGGKIPGLAGGKSATGGNDTEGKGWSFRLMWRKYDANGNNNGQPYLEPYAYYNDNPKTFGDNFREGLDKNDGTYRYTITDNDWYNVYMRVKMNTDTLKNGVLEMKVDGTTVLHKTDMRWATTNWGRRVDRVLWGIFRGGNDASYESDEDGFIDIDNVKITKL